MSDKNEDVALSIDDIASGGEVEYAKIPGFKPGQSVYIGSITAGDFMEWQEAGEGEAKKTAGLRLIVKSLVDGIPNVTKLKDGSFATGKRIANDSHIGMLRGKPFKWTESTIASIVKLNGMNAKGSVTKAEADAKND